MAAITGAGGPYRESGLGWPSVTLPAGTGSGGGPSEEGVRPAAGRVPGDPSLESGLGFRLGRAHRMVRESWEKDIADMGLSAPQAALLRAVAQRPDSGLRELARRMRTDAMNAKRLADHLERDGLVRSVSDPGHRQRRMLRPTAQGAVLASELARRAAAHERRLSALLGPADFSLLRALLERLESAIAPALTSGPGMKDLAL